MKSVNTDVAYEYLRQKILSGEFSPGYPLMTEALSAAAGMSRTPVRDALRKLEADGLVTIRPRQGASVKKMSVKEFREMCDLRLVLETHAAGLAAERRTESTLHEIEYALEAMRRLTNEIIAAPQDQPLLGKLMLEDVRFHVAIMAAADNELIKKEILRLHLINRVVWAPMNSNQSEISKADKDGRRRAVLAKHDEIFTAIARSDPIAAKSSMESHLQELIDHYLRVLARAESGMIARELTPEELSYNP
jgi:DNA-binding GntR family transcriptional regulator